MSSGTESRIRKAFQRWTDPEALRAHEDQVLLVLTLIIGALVGLMIVAFILLTENLGARMYPRHAAPWRRLIIPVAGSLIAGFLIRRFFPDARGSGIPQTKTALFIHDGVIRLRTVLGKFSCCSLTLASGVALGREGPSVQIGAGIASTLGRRLGLSPSRVRALVPIGAAAALAAAFNTPIAAVLFTLEEVVGDMHAAVLGSIVVSSATSWMVLHLMLGDEPLFHVPAYQLVHPAEFGIYLLLGVAGGLVSVAFVKLLLWQRRQFRKLPVNSEWVQPMVGGLTVGILGWFVPEVLGVGYEFVSQALNGQMAIGMMALLVVLKIVATTNCYASGNAGGIFGPSLFIGGMLGGAIGAAAHGLFPDYTGGVGAYALVGMGTAFAGIIRVPLTSVIMIFEITRDYSIIVPLMISNLVAYLVSSRLQPEPIYEALQHQDGVYLPPGARDRESVLTVQAGLRPATEALSAEQTVERAAAAVHGDDALPVLEDGLLAGMIAPERLRVACDAGRGAEPVSGLLSPETPDPGSEDLVSVHADDSLDLAMRRMAKAGLNALPVVSRTNVRELKGVISIRDIMTAYGLEKDESRPEIPPPPKAAPQRLFAGIVAALVLATVVVAFLSYSYRAQRATRARQFSKLGTELAAKERYDEAIQNFRRALSISHAPADRLSLGLALVAGGHLDEAHIYLDELVRANPNAGPANLGLGRLYLAKGDVPQAVAHFHRAIEGIWPPNAEPDRIQLRLELIRGIARLGAGRQAQAEMLALASDPPGDARTRVELGRLLLDNGLARQSAELLRETVQQARDNDEAWAGLGEAELAAGDLAAAESAFREAVRLAPAKGLYQGRLDLVTQVNALDPSARRLTVSERRTRAKRLLEAVVGSLDGCLVRTGQVLSTPDLALLDGARKVLAGRGREPLDEAVTTAHQLWDLRIRQCGAPSAAEEPVSRVLARLSR